MAKYADIILPLSLGTLTYSIPEGMELCEGDAVALPMGKSRDRFYAALVWRVHSTPPPFERVKPIISRLYGVELLNSTQRKFWEWIASYYLCSLGEVMRVALPSLVKAQGEDEISFQAAQFKPRMELYIDIIQRDIELIPAKAKAKRRAMEQIIGIADSCASNSIARRIIEEPISRLKSLEREGIIALSERELTPSSPLFTEHTLPQLTPAQQSASRAIEQAFTKHSTVLLHGVTGSGKSEIYMHHIFRALAKGGDVLMLLPEIALTAQIVERMEQVFGSRVSLYHSKLTARARTELYLQLAKSEGGNLVIGARSAILLPLKRLELIVVDEEHDASYKQSNPQPRYNARDCAVAYASMSGARTLLGSATPSIESWANAQSGKYGYVTLYERFGGSAMADITLSDTLKALKRGERRAHLNIDLKLSLESCTQRGEQAILFQNRRGMAPYIECPECAYTPKCSNCSVTLTLHSSRLECHYCGYSEPTTHICPKCGVGKPKAMGFGTERVEQAIGEMMPHTAIARLDADAASSPSRFRKIISSFESGDTQILIGTQMVTKGFDFAGVTLVGVLNADNLLLSPDFRAEERAFQLLTQIAGRAGRRDKASRVIIQTSQPEHRVLQFVRRGNYEAMATTLLEERALFLYPPYARLIDITLRHGNELLVHRAANELAARLRAIFSRRVLGPSAPPVERVRGEYIVKITLKIEVGQSSMKARRILSEEVTKTSSNKEFKSVKISFNVDPQ